MGSLTKYSSFFNSWNDFKLNIKHMLQSFNWGALPISYIQYSLTPAMFLVISILVVIVIILNQLLRKLIVDR